VKVNFISS